MAENSGDIILPEVLQFGIYANAFRVEDADGPDCFLDFLVHTSKTNKAVVVARVRVRKEFLPSIRDRLGRELGAAPAPAQEPPAPNLPDLPVPEKPEEVN